MDISRCHAGLFYRGQQITDTCQACTYDNEDVYALHRLPLFVDVVSLLTRVDGYARMRIIGVTCRMDAIYGTLEFYTLTCHDSVPGCTYVGYSGDRTSTLLSADTRLDGHCGHIPCNPYITGMMRVLASLPGLCIPVAPPRID